MNLSVRLKPHLEREVQGRMHTGRLKVHPRGAITTAALERAPIDIKSIGSKDVSRKRTLKFTRASQTVFRFKIKPRKTERIKPI